MRKMTPDQAASLKSFYQFIASGDDVLREEAYKMITEKLNANRQLKKNKKATSQIVAAVQELPKLEIESQVETIVPKKRGRPKKTEAVKAEEVKTAPAKRGRKPLTEEQKQARQDAKMAEKASQEPKKRGRKPKVQEPIVEVSKRGRKPLTPEQRLERQAVKMAPKLFNDLRGKLNLNQKQFGAVLGIAQSMVCQIEKGNITPSQELVQKVQKMLKTL